MTSQAASDQRTPQRFAYIGVNATTGSVRAIIMDDPEHRNSTAKDIAEWIRMGRTIERLPLDEANRRFRASVEAEDHASDQRKA